MRKEDILPFLTTQMDSKHIMFSEINHTQKKTSTVCYHLYVETKKAKVIKIESGYQGIRDGERVKWSRTLRSIRPHPLLAFCLWKNFSQRISLIREVRKCRSREKQSNRTRQ